MGADPPAAWADRGNAVKKTVSAFGRWLAAVLVATAPGLAAVLADAGPVRAADTIRLGLLKFGTVSWEIDAIRRAGLDVRADVRLDVVELASNEATKIALLGGEVDVIVSDWLYVARARAEGKDLAFVPFSTAVGALMVKADGPVKSLADLRGRRIGVSGGPLDKSWLLVLGHVRRTAGLDLAREASPEFGAPPLLAEKAARGELDAVLAFWNFEPRLRARGLTALLRVEDAAAGLGAKGPVSQIGYVFKESFAEANRAALGRFLAASRAAKALLVADDAAFEALRPLVRAEDDGEFRALRDGFRAGVPRRPLADEIADTRLLFEELARSGGEALVGRAKSLTDGTYWRGLGDGG